MVDAAAICTSGSSEPTKRKTCCLKIPPSYRNSQVFDHKIQYKAKYVKSFRQFVISLHWGGMNRSMLKGAITKIFGSCLFFAIYFRKFVSAKLHTLLTSSDTIRIAYTRSIETLRTYLDNAAGVHSHAIQGLLAQMVNGDADAFQYFLIFTGHVINERRDGVQFAEFVAVAVPLAAISYR